MIFDEKDDDLFRGFVWSSKAWYAKANKIKMGDICFGLYSKGGGTVGELYMEWGGERNIPILKSYNDSWAVLASIKDVIDALGKADDQNITEDDFVKILLNCGFVDRTPYKDIEQEKKKAVIKIDLPKTCSECPFWGDYTMCGVIMIATVEPENGNKKPLYPNAERASYCPLQTVDDK